MTTAPSDPSEQSAGRQSAAKRRDDRRKAALQANMARRKSQVRGRKQIAERATDGSGTPPDPDTQPDTRSA